MGYIVILVVVYLLAAWGLGIVTEIQEGFLYNGIIVGSLVMLGIFILLLPAHNAMRRKDNRRIIEKDGKELTELIHAIQAMPTEVDKVQEDQLHLSLDQQYGYIKSMENGLHELSLKAQEVIGKSNVSLHEMEQRLEKNLKDISRVPEVVSKSKSLLRPANKDYYLVNKFDSFNEILEKHFSERFGIKYDGPSGFHKLVPKLQERVETWRKEKGQLVWAVNQGVEGEQRIVENLELMLTEGHILESVRIVHMGRSAESDIIHVGSTGIHSLEIKNFGARSNWSIHISRDGQWRKVYPNGNREPMKDVGNQANYHVAIKERFLNEKLKELYGDSAPKMKVETAVVIANDRVMVDNESDLPVLRMSSVSRYLENGPDVLDSVWQTRVANLLEQYKKPGKPYAIPNLHAQLENLLVESEQLSSLYDLRYGRLIELSNQILNKDTPAEKETVEKALPSRTERRMAK